MKESQGPGSLDTSQVGQYTIAKSFLLSPRKIMAYGASIKDANNLFFDDLRKEGLVAHPFIAFSLQWNTRFTPQIPPNPKAAPYNVQAATDLLIHRPFREGDLITSQGKIISMEKIRPGVKQVTRYRMTDAENQLVAELDMIGIIRGADLSGPSVVLAQTQDRPLQPSSSDHLWQTSVEITADAAQIYTECADIYNPIHTERKVAIAAGLPDIILHGSATQAISASLIADKCLKKDITKIKRYYGELRAMVLMNSSITIRCIEEREANNGREIFFEVLNAEGEKAVANGYMLAET